MVSGPGAILAAMRRPFLALLVVLVVIGTFTGGLAWLLDTPRPPAGATKGERLYLGLCATCHGSDGRASWRAALSADGSKMTSFTLPPPAVR